MKVAREIKEPTWDDIHERDRLIYAAIGSLRTISGKQERRVLVRDAFGLGSGSAVELCKNYGFDPHELIGRRKR